MPDHASCKLIFDMIATYGTLQALLPQECTDTVIKHGCKGNNTLFSKTDCYEDHHIRNRSK
jgi:hypothetical protein